MSPVQRRKDLGSYAGGGALLFGRLHQGTAVRSPTPPLPCSGPHISTHHQTPCLAHVPPESAQAHRPVHGLIFLFKWRSEKDDRRTEPPDQGSVYFARQIITNACATQAIIGILFNAPAISLGQELTAFRGFTADLPPDLKGMPAIFREKKSHEAHPLQGLCCRPALGGMKGTPKIFFFGGNEKMKRGLRRL